MPTPEPRERVLPLAFTPDSNIHRIALVAVVVAILGLLILIGGMGQ